jgi:hypothetical protein
LADAANFTQAVELRVDHAAPRDLLAKIWTAESWKILIYPSWPGGEFSMKKS